MRSGSWRRDSRRTQLRAGSAVCYGSPGGPPPRPGEPPVPNPPVRPPIGRTPEPRDGEDAPTLPAAAGPIPLSPAGPAGGALPATPGAPEEAAAGDPKPRGGPAPAGASDRPERRAPGSPASPAPAGARPAGASEASERRSGSLALGGRSDAGRLGVLRPPPAKTFRDGVDAAGGRRPATKASREETTTP